jgi:hypothetical protein
MGSSKDADRDRDPGESAKPTRLEGTNLVVSVSSAGDREVYDLKNKQFLPPRKEGKERNFFHRALS